MAKLSRESGFYSVLEGAVAEDKLLGVVVRWQDDKGFGFIHCKKLSEDVFFHIREYRPSKRPVVGEQVVFSLGRNAQGKPQAMGVQEWQFVRQQQRKQQKKGQEQQAFKTGQNLRLMLVAVFYGWLWLWFGLGKLSLLVPVWYVVLGIWTFFLYWHDKSAAQSGHWRTKESTLHLFSLLGGWAGAWLAQTYLRHKSQKASFKMVYYVTVIANGLLLSWVMGQQDAAHAGAAGLLNNFMSGLISIM